MEIVEYHHKRASMIITSQLPENCWHEVIREKIVTDAILDRIVHDANRLELRGESMKKTHEKQKNMEIMN
jgi:DNA replication protein DnaC